MKENNKNNKRAAETPKMPKSMSKKQDRKSDHISKRPRTKQYNDDLLNYVTTNLNELLDAQTELSRILKIISMIDC